jgi:hypothetical protein
MPEPIEINAGTWGKMAKCSAPVLGPFTGRYYWRRSLESPGWRILLSQLQDMPSRGMPALGGLFIYCDGFDDEALFGIGIPTLRQQLQPSWRWPRRA